jgi:hypothetical protein
MYNTHMHSRSDTRNILGYIKNIMIDLHWDEPVTGPCWFLDPIGTANLELLSAKIKQIEWDNAIRRIRAPHIVSCKKSEAEAKRGDEYFRFVNDIWKDNIDKSIAYVINSYKDLPYILSMETDIYADLQHKYMWVVASYGGSIKTILEKANELNDEIVVRTETSSIKIRDYNNQLFHPQVEIMEVTLISSKHARTNAGPDQTTGS